jgi:hypothetical protein
MSTTSESQEFAGIVASAPESAPSASSVGVSSEDWAGVRFLSSPLVFAAHQRK